MDFVAIDVETACSERSSICQVGFAVFQKGELVRCERRLINPETQFLAFNTGLHGITPEDVVGALTWRDIYPDMRGWISNRTIVSHTLFDREALFGACKRYGFGMFPYSRWIDTCTVARRTWPDLPDHKLATLARCFGIEYRAHDAAEDARAAGEILLLLIEQKKNNKHEKTLAESSDSEEASNSLVPVKEAAVQSL